MSRTRIAMLTPSSNTVVEPYTSAMVARLFPDVSVHFGRFRVTTIALNDESNRQFALEPILEAADLLADARPDVIAWNGTSASWLGFERDEALCREITDRTGIAATSAILSLNDILRESGVVKLGLVTPYTSDVQDRIVSNYARIGVEVVSERHAELSDNFSFSDISEEAIATMCEHVAAARPQAIAIVCTNMRGPMIAASLEQRLGIPILDSIAFTLWGCLRATGTSMRPLREFGSIFAQDHARG